MADTNAANKITATPDMPASETAALSQGLTATQAYQKYAEIVAKRAAQYAASSGTLLRDDKADARRACDQIVRRVVDDLLLEVGQQEAGEHYPLYRQYVDDPDFKARLEDYAFVKAYLEPKNTAQEAQITPEAAGEPEKEYDLGYGFLGNGITVWNRAEQRDNDYMTVAHISTERSVTIYDQDMPTEVRQRIDTVANSPDTWAHGFSPAPENMPPNIEGASAPASIYESVKRALPETLTKNDARMPDPTVNIRQMKEYGYENGGMVPLSESWALQFYDSNTTIYLLYPDNTEAIAFDREEIANHDGLFGIDCGDWERSPEYAAKQAEAANAEGKREADLLYGDNQYSRENKIGIYQVRDDLDPARGFRFVPMRELEALGLPVERKNYELVYTAPLLERIEFLSDRYPALNKIYQDFNVNLPDDYRARSVSVSDVIVLRHNGDISAFYVDRVGFEELDGFLGEETRREHMKTPEKPAPTVAELEADVKAGKSISVMDLAKAAKAANAERKPVTKAKPSLLGRLDEAKKQVERNKKTATAANKSERS